MPGFIYCKVLASQEDFSQCVGWNNTFFKGIDPKIKSLYALFCTEKEDWCYNPTWWDVPIQPKCIHWREMCFHLDYMISFVTQIHV